MPELLPTGGRDRLEGWLEAFTARQVSTLTPLALTAAWCALQSGRPAEPWITAAEHGHYDAGRKGESQAVAAATALLRAVVARHGVAQMVADAELAGRLQEPDDAWVPTTRLVRAVAAELAGSTEEARSQLEGLELLADRTGALEVRAAALGQLGLLDLETQDLTGAAARAEQALALMRGHGLLDAATLVQVHCLAALVAARQGRRGDAAALVQRGVRAVALTPPPAAWAGAQCRLLLARAELILGDPPAARTLLSEAQALLAEVPDAPLLQASTEQFFLAPGVSSAYINAKVAVIRQRTVLDGFHETISVTNHDSAPATLEVALSAAADFADLFEVKDATVSQKPGRNYQRPEADRLVLGYERDSYRRETWIRATGEPRYEEGGLRFTINLPPQASWSTEIDVLAVRGNDLTAAFHEPAAWTDPESRLGLKLLKQSVPVLACSWKPMERIYERSMADLAALRFDLPISPGHFLPAAGLPWFMAAFGRDSLITSFQALPFMPELAHTALVTLAELQAVRRDDFRDAEPGKMLHELRFGELTAFEERPHSPYYGSADGTQLWLVLLDEYERWTGRADVVHALEGPARAALRWIDEHGDRDGDGYVEYERRNADTGLENQCWRDSWDSIQYADGTLASLPRATCELQGYVYDAKRRSARLAREIWDDAALADRLEREAAELKARFNRDFWLPDHGYYALALDGDKRPVDSLSSNLGHLLWSGIVDDDRVERVVELLMSDRLYSGWGIRTFATGQVGYNPIGYHLGTVWPHDTAFAVLALAQRGYRAQAAQVAMSLLEAADLLGDRLPEAFAGFPREQTAFPAEYPTACSPQAWASGAPLMLLRALLGLEPDGAVLRSTASLPEQIRELRLYRVPGRWGAVDVGVDLSGEVIRLDRSVGEPSPVLQALIEAAQQVPGSALRGRRLSIGFDIGDAGRYRVVGDDGRVSLDSHVDAADCVLTTDEQTLAELLRGERNPTTALMSGKARLRGDVELATRMLSFLSRLSVPAG